MSLRDSIWREATAAALSHEPGGGWAGAGPSTGHDVTGSCGPSWALGEAGSCPLTISAFQKGAETSSSLFVVCGFL